MALPPTLAKTLLLSATPFAPLSLPSVGSEVALSDFAISDTRSGNGPFAEIFSYDKEPLYSFDKEREDTGSLMLSYFDISNTSPARPYYEKGTFPSPEEGTFPSPEEGTFPSPFSENSLWHFYQSIADEISVFLNDDEDFDFSTFERTINEMVRNREIKSFCLYFSSAKSHRDVSLFIRGLLETNVDLSADNWFKEFLLWLLGVDEAPLYLHLLAEGVLNDYF